MTTAAPAFLRRAEIVRLARHLGVADTDDFDRFLLAWFWHRPLTADRDPVGALIDVAARMGKPDLSTACAKEIIDAARHGQLLGWKANELGQYLRLSDEVRTLLGIRTIGAFDVSTRQRKARRKRKDRERHERLRRERGAKPQSKSQARTRPWEAGGISESTWRRQRRKERMKCQAIPSTSTPDVRSGESDRLSASVRLGSIKRAAAAKKG
jgi:hypothetical protein